MNVTGYFGRARTHGPLRLRRLVLWSALLLALCTSSAVAQDPFASNNTLYPKPEDWSRGFRPSNFDYPTVPQKPQDGEGRRLMAVRSRSRRLK